MSAAVAVALATTNSNNNLLPLSLHTALNASSSNTGSNSISSSPERMTSANCHAQSNTICRVIAIDDEESRECPSQGASEIARDDIYHLGIDARGGGVCPAQQTTRHVLYTMYNNNGNTAAAAAAASSTEVHPFSRRVSGLPCQRVVSNKTNDTAFIERRDCNSFDSIDADPVDECVSQLRNSYPGKYHQQLPTATSSTTTATAHQWGQRHHQLAMSAALVVEAARRKSLAASTTIAVDDSKNKRKTPSPVMGIEPAPVSAEPLFDNDHEQDESMDMEEDFNSHVDEAHYQPSPTIQKSHTLGCHNDVTLPSPGRRVSLSPISRRLAFQFDSISFYSPVRPSTKRRKTFDTSAICP